MFGLDLHGWETVMVGSLILAAAATLAVGVSTWLVVKLQREKVEESELALEQYKIGAEVKINEAREGAAIASERAAAIAQANIALQTNLEREKAERLKLEAAVAPRAISPDQSAALTAAWRKFAKKRVLVVSYTLDAEAAFLGQELLKALHRAGVEVVDATLTTVPSGNFNLGIHVTAITDQPWAHGIAEEIGRKTTLAVIYHPKPLPEGVQMILGGPDRSNFEASIFVGFKPIPGTKERQERAAGP